MTKDKALMNIHKNNTQTETSSNIRSGVNVSTNNTDNNNTYANTTNNNSDYSSTVTTEVYNDAPPGTIEYYVKEGETLESIAKDNNITVEELKKLNTDLMNDEISKDDRLFIPAPKNSSGNKGKSGGGSGGGNNNDSNKVSNSGAKKDSESSSGGGSSNNNTEEEQYTDDSSSINVDDSDQLFDNFRNSLLALLEKYNYTGGEFEQIYDFVQTWGIEQGYPTDTVDDMLNVFKKFFEENPDYTKIDEEDLEEILCIKELLDSIGYDYTDEDSSTVDEDYSFNLYESIIQTLLEQLGYKESEIEEFSTFDILNIISDNKSKIDDYLKDKLGEDYDLGELISLYVLNHYQGLAPQSEDFDVEELLGIYQEEAINILSNFGENVENLYDMNPYEIINKLVEHQDDINKLLNSYGANLFDQENGFERVFTDVMANVAYFAASQDEDMLTKYIDANGYSEDAKTDCLKYFKEGNIRSAFYVLKIEDLDKEKMDNDNRIDQIDNEIKDIVTTDPEYLDKRAMGYSFDDSVASLSQNNTKVQELLAEKQKIEARNNEIGSEKYEAKQGIITNSYQKLEPLRETEEYTNALSAGDGKITSDSEFLRQIDLLLEQGKTINIYELYRNTSLSSDLSTLDIVINNLNELDELGDDEEDLKINVINRINTMSTGFISNIEDITNNDDEIIIRIINNGVNVNVKYNINDKKTTYEFEEDGNIILTTEDPNGYTNINYFELFEYIQSKEPYSYYSKENMLEQVFGYDPLQETEYGEIFNLSALAYLHLEEDELNDYKFLYETQGMDAANKYLETKRDSIHQKAAMQGALDEIQYIMDGNETFRTGVVGLEDGVQGWFDNVYAFFSKDTTMTINEYESQYLLSILSSYAKPIDLSNKNLDEEILSKIEDPEKATYLDYYFATGEITEDEYTNLKNNPNYQSMVQNIKENPALTNYAYMIGQNVGNMLPSVIGSFLLSPLGGITIAGHFIGAGQAAASMLLFAGAYGGSYKEAVRSGHDELTSNLYATLSALSEITTEYFLGRIPGIGRISESISPAIYQNIGQLLGIRAINLIKDIGGEILEESLQIWIDYALKSSLLGEKIDLSGWPKEQLDTMIVTTFTTLILGFPASYKTLLQDIISDPTIKIDEKTEITIPFKDILRLNETYVNSETGEINMEGLVDEINKILEGEEYYIAEGTSEGIIIKEKEYEFDDNEYIEAINKAKYKKTVNGVTFASKTEEGLQKLIDYYENSIKEDPRGEYYKGIIGGKNLTITDIPYTNNQGSYHWEGIVYYNNRAINNNMTETFYHELGHFLDYYSGNKFQDTYNDFINKAIAGDVSQSSDIQEIARALQQLNPAAIIRIEKSGNGNTIYSSVPIENLVLPAGFESTRNKNITNNTIDQNGYVNYYDIADYYEVDENILAPAFDIEYQDCLQKAVARYESESLKLDKEANERQSEFEAEAIRRYKENNPLSRVVPDTLLKRYIEEYVQNESERIKMEWMDKQYRERGIAALSDIIDAITSGDMMEGTSLTLMNAYGHGREYYGKEINRYKETLANIAALYHTDNRNILYECFPKEYIDELINSYEELLEIQKVKNELDEDLDLTWFVLDEADSFINSDDNIRLLHLYEENQSRGNNDNAIKYERYLTFESTSNQLFDSFSDFYDSIYLSSYYNMSVEKTYSFKNILEYYLNHRSLPDSVVQSNPIVARDLLAFLELQTDKTISRYWKGL